MKRLSPLFLCFLLVVISSCTEEENLPLKNVTAVENLSQATSETSNYFMFNDQKFATPFATKSVSGNYYELVFATEDFFVSDYSGGIDFISISVKSTNGEIVPGIYTFTADADASENLYALKARMGLQYVNGNPQLYSGYSEKIASGIVIISKNKDSYTIEYKFGSFEGTYIGEIQNSEAVKF